MCDNKSCVRAFDNRNCQYHSSSIYTRVNLKDCKREKYSPVPLHPLTATKVATQSADYDETSGLQDQSKRCEGRTIHGDRCKRLSRFRKTFRFPGQKDPETKQYCWQHYLICNPGEWVVPLNIKPYRVDFYHHKSIKTGTEEEKERKKYEARSNYSFWCNAPYDAGHEKARGMPVKYRQKPDILEKPPKRRKMPVKQAAILERPHKHRERPVKYSQKPDILERSPKRQGKPPPPRFKQKVPRIWVSRF